MKPTRTISPQLSLAPRSVSACLVAVGILSALPAWANDVPQMLPFSQNWNSTGLISAANDWSGVPGIVGYRGDNLTSATGTDPQTLLTLDAVVNLLVDQTAPNTFNTGGVAEFELANPTIALNGSGTADAPSIVISLNTLGRQAVQVNYTLRDLDGSVDNVAMPVALQYRLGNTGPFVNVPAGFVADATSGPNLATLTTAVSAALPTEADNQALVQVRIITTNAVGNDEWVGIDDIVITGSGGEEPPPVVVNSPIATICPPNPTFTAGVGGNLAFSASDTDSVVNSVTLSSTAVPGITLESVSTATTDGGTASGSVVVASTVGAGSYPVQVGFANNELQSALCNVTVTVTGLVSIPEIQGSDSRSARVGQLLSTTGVVTRLLNNGFFMQDPVGDGDGDTSDGIFVFTSSAPTVQVGQAVRVDGTVSEFAPSGANAAYQPLTQLGFATTTVLSSGNTVSPTVITLPEMVEGELERYEGMLVFIQTPMTASQNFFQGRFGQVTLGANGRLVKPTNEHPAGSLGALELAEDNAKRRIILDDGSSLQNPNPTPYIGEGNTLRAGDTLPNGITGVIDYGLATNIPNGLSDYKIHPTGPVVFVRDNPRPAASPAVGGNVRVGSFNVLNYFTTIDQAGAACFPGNVRGDCRGADSTTEFDRQVAKIVPAILGLNADVVGLMEIENNGNTAVQDLVNRLNAVAGVGTYASVGSPTGGTGGDAIRVAMVYKPARLSPVGAAVSDTASVHNRPPLAQTFSAANGERFSVVVNHFKSKGSCPGNASDLDADQGDGQGCWNMVRTEQAQALSSFINSILVPVDPDVVIVGDLNAYGKEDPILELSSAGLVDQIDRFNDQAYSYVFDGESGYLDHGLTSASLSPFVTGAVHWHINADEPSIIDYNTEFKQPAVPTAGPDYYAATVYRSSDHDSVLLGLSLVKTVQGTAGRDTLVGTPGDDLITGGAGADVITGGSGADTFVYTSTRDAADRITDFVPGTDRVDLSALLQGLGYTGSNAIGDGFVRLVDSASGLMVQIDTDGNAGRALARPLLTLTGVSVAQVNAARDIRF